MKGSTTSKTSQSSEPPAWAKPLLTQAASSAQNLFNSGQGYNVYRGPTVADFSQQKIDALNKIMAATGGGAPVSNAAMTGDQNPQVQQQRALIEQQQQQRQAYLAQQAAATAAAQAAAKQQPKQSSSATSMYPYAWDTRTGTPFKTTT
jgi:hypothetical protein